MSGRLQKILLGILAVLLLLGASQVQRTLNVDRDRLGLSRVAPLEDAPPVLVFTTVALGGFRGLISNALWMRATELQDQDKFFEMVQLADWITKLEPHFVQVWAVQAWNMAYNISVKFKDFSDRWRWVQRGIELLRDQGLRYNPNELILYRELGWFFQHKMGANLDDAHYYYKIHWAEDMAKVLGGGRPDFDALIHPKTPEDEERARVLREKYKMDPAVMKQADDEYGPLEWRLPEASAIYWASAGLERARENPTKTSKDDILMLKRMIWQSLLLAMHRGRLVLNPYGGPPDFSPNLDIIPKLNAAFEEAIRDDEKDREVIRSAHRNALRDAVYFLYEFNRQAEAARWYRYIAEHYPDKQMLDDRPDSLPAKMTYDQYAIARIQEDIGESDPKRIRAVLQGMLRQSFVSLAMGEDDQAAGLMLMAQRVLDAYKVRTTGSGARVNLPPLEEMEKLVLRDLLDPENGLPLAARNVIISKIPAALVPRFGPGPNEPPPSAAGSRTNAPSRPPARGGGGSP